MTTRRTPLYALQASRGAKFVPFAGWELPVQFSGLVAEHKAVREAAGLFDVSHMGEVRISGPDALPAVEMLVTNEVARLEDGKALYTVMCVGNGGIVDDLIIYRESAHSYFLCINAGRREADVAHMAAICKKYDVTFEDLSENYAQLALQGPKAKAILQKLTEDAALADLGAFSWKDGTVAGIHVRVAQTGYTGEHGYELYVAPAQASALWQAIVDAGVPYGLLECGLGARDTLRLEVKYPLYGNDIDLEHNAYEAGLGWVVKLNKKHDFIGKEALVAIKAAGPARKWVGIEMLEKSGAPRHGYAIYDGDREVGVVTSGTHSPSLGKPIAVGYVPSEMAAVGTPLFIDIRGKRVAAHIVKTPFYVRGES